MVMIPRLVSKRSLSLEKHRLEMPVSSTNCVTISPDAASQSITVLNDAHASRLPSGEKATMLTQFLPRSVFTSAPDAMSQSLTVVSSDPDASCLPSGEKTTSWTMELCPSSSFTSPDAVSQSQPRGKHVRGR